MGGVGGKVPAAKKRPKRAHRGVSTRPRGSHRERQSHVPGALLSSVKERDSRKGAATFLKAYYIPGMYQVLGTVYLR